LQGLLTTGQAGQLDRRRLVCWVASPSAGVAVEELGVEVFWLRVPERVLVRFSGSGSGSGSGPGSGLVPHTVTCSPTPPERHRFSNLIRKDRLHLLRSRNPSSVNRAR